MAKHRLEIEFCVRCKLQGRAFWLARELVDARPDIADEIVLIPSSGGVFIVRFDGETVADIKRDGRYPEPRDVRESILAISGLPPTPSPH